MIDFWEVVRRSENGELVKEHDFDMRVVRACRSLVKKYDLKFNPEEVVPSDDAMVDRLFEAAIEYFLTVGVYCTDTERVIKFTRDELEGALNAGTDRIIWGEGREQRVQTPRKVEDPRPPFCNFTLVGTPYSEETFLQAAMSTAKEDLADCFSAGSILHTLGGVEVRSGSPSEVEAAIWDVGKRREAAIRVGRPGKGMYTQVSAAEKADAMIAAARREFGALDRDGVLMGAIAEMKVDYDRMKKVPFLQRTTYTMGGLMGPLMGGYSGGPEGSAINTLAHLFLGRMAFMTEYTNFFPIDIHETCNTTRPMLWLVSMCHQAMARNTHLLHFANTFIAAGPCTDFGCYELINHGITASVSGAALSPASSARNMYPERCTGMEGRIAAEAAHAAALSGMTRKDVNELVKKILPKYEDKIKDAPKGQKLSQCYDLSTVTPTDEYLELYQRIKQEVSEMGLDYSLVGSRKH
jgi:methylamine---corrinoid protein Co-methyltransferase